LAGGFNANIIRRPAAYMRERRQGGAEGEVVTVGRKGRDWLLRYDPGIRAEFTALPDAPTSNDIGAITRILVDDFTSGHFDEVFMIYTDFVNTLRQVPTVQQLLPVVPAAESKSTPPDYIFEPSPGAVLQQVLYGFTEVLILQSLYESLASEH